MARMVRPERRVDLAGGSPVRVSAGAPGSRLQPSAEIRPSRAECQKRLEERGANQRAATTSERGSLVALSTERCSSEPTRSCHGEGNRQHSRPEGMLDLSGVSGGGTLEQSNAEQGRPYLAAQSGKDRVYKAGRPKSRGTGWQSEGSLLPGKACSITRWREGTLLWSSRLGRKRKGMPATASHASVKARQLRVPATDVCQVRSSAMDSGEGWRTRSGDPSRGPILSERWRHARHVKKIIGKPCAGRPHARFERELMETGWRQTPLPRHNPPMSLSKTTVIKERFVFELRLETFNAFNRVVFGAPYSNISNPSAFGMITTQANSPRNAQLVGKLDF